MDKAIQDQYDPYGQNVDNYGQQQVDNQKQFEDPNPG